MVVSVANLKKDKANKYARLKFALGFVKHDVEIQELLNYVHIDEKWFYLTKTNRKYYLIPGETALDRKCKSKRFVTKVMFLAAVARPHFVGDTGTWWDGKIGTWPFVETVLAQRSSNNRSAGSPETKPITVTKDVYREFLQGLACHRREVADERPSRHDTARQRPSLRHGVRRQVAYTLAELAKQDWSISLAPQPPNSRDTNILDLGFFAGIQSLQHQKSARSIDELVAHVADAFVEYPFEHLDRTFLTLQSCLIETMKVNGDNTYKIPHMAKEKKQRLGILPRNVVCPVDTFDAARAALVGTRVCC
ncbi:hypothetical protein H257_01572 [Aphanomyces astaci]|uniref:Uncharacterized protein n=1 Tax=Aphanomyces astaci TaxID=112090 RepID=W4H8B9_APHAT|nr:hypothetical protein H257_01572 [Aphanomyces astaci]ETV88280.1 hypothetical protein H257_01572 [Aphanomyces astaci]|eukprot:XP_009823143.1 hypothetical protein H257_01572 [Aphanomyces astaci]